jgi:hypothetical protein
MALSTRLLGCVICALFAACVTSSAALGATSAESSGPTPEAPPAAVTGNQGSGTAAGGEGTNAGTPGPGATPEASSQSGGSATAGATGAAGGTAAGGSGTGRATEDSANALGSPGQSHAGESGASASSGSAAAGASSSAGASVSAGANGSSGSETTPAHQGTGGVQQSPARGSAAASGAGSAGGGEGGSGASASHSGPPSSGGTPTAAGVDGAAAPTAEPAGVPAQIVSDTLSASPFTPEQLALAGALSGGEPPGPGGTPARVVVAKVPAQGSLTLSCLTRSRAVRCQLLLARQDPRRLSLAYTAPASGTPGGQALAASADSDHFTPPPAGGAGVPGSGEMVGGSSSAASGVSAGTGAAMLMLALALLLGSPLILRRLLDVCERWLASPLDLVLERPD